MNDRTRHERRHAERPCVRRDDGHLHRAEIGTWGAAPRARRRPGGRAVGEGPGGSSPARAGMTGHHLASTGTSRGTAPRARGTTTFSPSAIHVSQEQPRVRGDDDLDSARADLRWGTAPRARGRPRCLLGRATGRGTAPLPRGRPSQCPTRAAPAAEQPRGAGDDRELSVLYQDDVGTAPACAGMTSGTRSRTRIHWEQPRVRGRRAGQPP